MSNFRINISPDDSEVRQALQGLVDAGNDMEPLFASIGEYLVPVHEERWENSTDKNGVVWEGLFPETWAKKKNKHRMLYEEGDLLRGPIYQASADGLDFGISDWKAPIHHFGVEENNLPARELLGINQADELEILELMSEYIQDTWES